MGSEQNEKALRLKTQLQEELKPLIEKIDALETEVVRLRKTQKEFLEKHK